MKAICIERFNMPDGVGLCIIDKGEHVNYSVNDDRIFIVNQMPVHPTTFFMHFRAIEGDHKMQYSDFEYILCNYIFEHAVLFPDEYNGVHSLIIQNWDNSVIMITANKLENVIRVSFSKHQESYSSYEEALEGIRQEGKSLSI